MNKKKRKLSGGVYHPMEKQHSVDKPAWKVREKNNSSLSQPRLFPGWWGIRCTIQVNDPQELIALKEQKNSSIHLWGTSRNTHTQDHGKPPLGADVSSERVEHRAEFRAVSAKWAQSLDSKKGRGPHHGLAVATNCSTLCVAVREATAELHQEADVTRSSWVKPQKGSLDWIRECQYSVMTSTA